MNESSSEGSGKEPSDPPIVPPMPAIVAFENEQSRKGDGFTGLGGCGCLLAIVGAGIGIFTAGLGGALSWLVIVGGISAIFFIIGFRRRRASDRAVAIRREGLTAQQREDEDRIKVDYTEARGISASVQEQARAQNEATALEVRGIALASPLRTSAGELVSLYSQNSLLMTNWRFQTLSGNLSLRLNDAEFQMHEAEKVVFIAAAETSAMRTNVIVVTTARLAVVKSGGTQWTALEDVTGANARSTVLENFCELTISTRGSNYRWTAVEPKSVGFEIAKALGPGKPPMSPMAVAEIRTVVARSSGKYAGGTLKWPGTSTNLRDNIDVQAVLTDDQRLQVICDGHVLLEASITDPGVIIDTTETVGRSLKGGPAVLVAGSALLLGPLALLATPLAIGKKRVKQHLVLAMSVEDESALISLEDTGAAIRMRAATSNAVGQPDIILEASSDPESEELQPPSSTATTLAELERLQGLLQSGVLTDEEFAVLKARILNPEIKLD